PIWFALAIFLHGLDVFRPTNAAAIAIAMRVRREIQQEVLSYKWRKIDSLWSAQICVHCKCRNLNLVHKLFETGDTTQLHRLGEQPARPERASGDADVDIVMQQTGATNFVWFQFREWAAFLTFEMETL